MILGITGGIASGKSTVSDFLKSKGYVIIDADEISRKITQKGQKGAEAILKSFGGEFFENGELNRKKLSEYCFNNSERTSRLNSILHPIILGEMDKETEKHKNASVIILDVPLLFETGMDKKCDKVLTVYCNKEERIKRGMARSGISREEMEKRIARQMTDEEKIKKSDYSVDNSGSMESTFEKIEIILREIDNEEKKLL